MNGQYITNTSATMKDLVLVNMDRLKYVHYVKTMKRICQDFLDNSIVLCKVKLVGVDGEN